MYAFKSKRKLQFYVDDNDSPLNLYNQNRGVKLKTTLSPKFKKQENISNTTTEFSEIIKSNINSNETFAKSKIAHDVPKFLVNDDIINLVHVNDTVKNDPKQEITERKKKKTRNLDTYAESLLYVNKIYNKAYGLERRRVPAHIPLFLDRNVISEMQMKFFSEFEKTSSHRIRNSEDMQFAFSYFYFLLSEKRAVSAGELFDMFDTDKSR